MVNENLSKMLNVVFAWSQSIRREANRCKNDGIDDSALIIQEAIENYLHREGINPRSVINYEEHGKKGKVRYDDYYNKQQNKS